MAKRVTKREGVKRKEGESEALVLAFISQVFADGATVLILQYLRHTRQCHNACSMTLWDPGKMW